MIADGRQLERLPVVDVEVSVLTAAQPADRLSRMSPRIHEENAEHVELLVAAGTAVPPIIVHRPTMRVIDGLHRLRAAQRCGRRTIGVRFFDGDEAAAFVLAVTANAGHGLPLSLADRKRAAARIVGCYPRWSDRKIASITGLAPGTVAGIRLSVSSGADGANGLTGVNRLIGLTGSGGMAGCGRSMLPSGGGWRVNSSRGTRRARCGRSPVRPGSRRKPLAR